MIRRTACLSVLAAVVVATVGGAAGASGDECAWGASSAFGQAYRGREPSPATVMAARLPINLGRPSGATLAAPVDLSALALPALPVSATMVTEAPPAPVNDRLPRSTVKPEFENSGRWLSDVPPPSVP